MIRMAKNLFFVFFNLILLKFIFNLDNLSNRYPPDLSWSEYRNEETEIQDSWVSWARTAGVLTSTGCSWDGSELRILVLYWSETFEESLAQGCLQLASSVGPFPSCLEGPTMLPPFLFSFLLQYHIFFIVHTLLLCTLSFLNFCYKIHAIGFHILKHPELFSLWSL